MSTSVGTIVVHLVGDAARYQQMLRQVEVGTANTVATVEHASQQIENYGTKLMEFARAMVMAIASNQVMREFGKFDKAMTQSLSIMETTTEQEQAMKKAAMEMTAVHAAQPFKIAKAYYYLASAGLNAEQAIAALPQVVKFATAGAFDLETAANLATAAQASMGMRAVDAAKNLENLTRVTDVLVKSNIIAQGNTKQFAIALGNQAGAEARFYKRSIEEASAALAVFADQNVKGLKAGTSYARTLRLLAKSAVTPKDREAQKALGIEVFEPNTGKMRNLADIIENIEKAFVKMSPELQAATLMQVGFSERTQSAIKPLIGYSHVMRRYQKILEDVGGLTHRVSDKQMTAFANQMQILRNTFAVAAIEIGEMLAPRIIYMADSLKYAINWWRQLDNRLKLFVIDALGVFSVLVSLRLIIYSLGVIIGTGLAPIALLMAALSIGVTYAIHYFGGFKEILTQVLSVVNELISDWDHMVASIVAAAKIAWEWIEPVRAKLAQFFNFIIETGRDILGPVVVAVMVAIQVFRNLWDVLINIESFLKTYVKPMWDQVTEAISRFIERNWEAIKAITGTALAIYLAVKAYSLLSAVLLAVNSLIAATGVYALIARSAVFAWNASIVLLNITIVMTKVQIVLWVVVLYSLLTVIGSLTATMVINRGIMRTYRGLMMVLTSTTIAWYAAVTVGVVAFGTVTIILSTLTAVNWLLNTSMVALRATYTTLTSATFLYYAAMVVVYTGIILLNAAIFAGIVIMEAFGLVIAVEIAIIQFFTYLINGAYLSIGLLTGVTIAYRVAVILMNGAIGMALVVQSIWTGYLWLYYNVLTINITTTMIWRGLVISSTAVVRAFTFVWVALRSVINLTNIAFGLVMVGMVAMRSVTILTSAAMTAWTSIMAAVRTALLAVQAAVTATNVVMGVAGFLAIAGAVLAIYSAFSVLYGAVMSVYEAGKAVFSLFGGLDTSIGPVATLTGMFGEMWGNIMLVVRAFKTDMPLAMEIAGVAAKMAIAQVADVFPSLWKFIKEGFTIAWKLVAVTFSTEMSIAIHNAKIGISRILPFSKKTLDKSQEQFTDAGKRLQRSSLLLAQAELEQLNKGFSYKESDKIKVYRKELEILKDQLVQKEGPKPPPVWDAQALLDEMDKWLSWGNMSTKMINMMNRAEDLGEGIGEQFVGGVKKALGTLDAVLFGSAKSFRTYQAYLEMLNLGESPAVKAARQAHTWDVDNSPMPRDRPVAEWQWRGNNEINTKILGDIRDILRTKKTIEIDGVNLDDF